MTDTNDKPVAGPAEPTPVALNPVADALARVRNQLAEMVSGDATTPEAAPEKTVERAEPVAETPPAERPPAVETEAQTDLSHDAETTTTEPAADEPAPDLDDLKLTKEQRDAIGRKFAERITEAKQRYSAKAEAELAELKARAERAEFEAAEARSRAEAIEQAPSPIPAVMPDPVAELKKAEADKATFESLKESLADEPEAVAEELRKAGVKVTNLSGEESYDRASMRRALTQFIRATETRATEARAKAETFAKQEAVYVAEAVKLVPSLKDAKSEEFRTFQRILTTMPQLKASPQWAYLAAVHTLGLKVAKEKTLTAPKAATAEAPKVERKLPPKVLAPGNSVTVAGKREVIGEGLRTRAFTEGDMEAVQEYTLKALRGSF